MKTSSIDSMGTLYFSTACFNATAPSSGAFNDLKTPLKEPTGVLDAATITTELEEVDFKVDDKTES